jgi:hypothetical protein
VNDEQKSKKFYALLMQTTKYGAGLNAYAGEIGKKLCHLAIKSGKMWGKSLDAVEFSTYNLPHVC